MSKNSPTWFGPFTDVPQKTTPVTDDLILIGDSAASGARKYTTLSQLSSARCGGAMYVSSPAATISVGTTPVKANGTTTATRTDNFSHPASNRLQYTDSITKKFEVAASISSESSVGNVILSMFVAKNGSHIAASEITRKIGTANDVGNASLLYDLDLAQNDYIEVFIAIDTGTSNITVDKMIVSVKEI